MKSLMTILREAITYGANIYFEVERDQDDEGTFVFAYDSMAKDAVGGDLCIGHLHVPDENVGETFFAGDVSVNPSYRRMGIASKMYELMENELSIPSSPATWQSPDGKAFWDNRKK